MSQQVLSISQVNEFIRGKMDNDPLLSGVAVRGEISNYKVYPSGHHYFTLKDDGASLKCVMFRGSAIRLRFKPENGMQVLASGKISVYPRDGAYQLYCTGLLVDGIGDLHVAFEQLKTKLAAQGIFDQQHKKTIPKYPKTIGIVTSSAGAALHDMLRILNKRYPIARVKLLPVRVQGAEAPEEIAAAIDYANAYHLADLLIVGRGGGSIEDLWAFNDERVAYAIFRSAIPIISGVGHEPDVTISDYVADLRAATPSNAAEMAVPDREALYQMLDSYSVSLSTSLTRLLKVSRQQLRMLASRPALQTPDFYILKQTDNLNLLRNRLDSSQKNILHQSRQRFLSQAAKLDALSPLKVLTRGYAMVQTKKGSVVRSVNDVSIGENLDIQLHDGTVNTIITSVKESSL